MQQKIYHFEKYPTIKLKLYYYYSNVNYYSNVKIVPKERTT